MGQEITMKRPIKDESMIEKASTIHEQMLLDYIENQEKYIDELEDKNKDLQTDLNHYKNTFNNKKDF